MIIESSAPTRIDLAGGTMDIWPLYLFHLPAQTINIAINQRATVRMEQVPGLALDLRSEDLDISMRLTSIDYISEVEPDHPLEILLRLLEFFRPEGGLNITTSCKSPTGAGLGGSSAIALAVCGALNVLTHSRYSREELLVIAKNIETQVLKVPGGVQDYYPALYGGLNSVVLDVKGDSLMRYSPQLARSLQSRMVLVYTGQNRNSGINNWTVTKAHIDKDPKVWTCFDNIRKATAGLEHALKTESFNSIPKYLEEDMENHHQLSPTIITDEMKGIIDYGKANGAKAAKVCGAGGGGCLLFWTNSLEDKVKLSQKFQERDGVEVINFHIDSEGLSVESI